MQELADFAENKIQRIFTLYGLPQIGKSYLIDYFLNNKLDKNTSFLEIDLGNDDKKPNDKARFFDEITSYFKCNKLENKKDIENFVSQKRETFYLYLDNFEKILQLKANENTHYLKKDYSLLNYFLTEVSRTENNFKIIINSRYKINFDYNASRKSLVSLKDGELQGIGIETYKQDYLDIGISEENYTKIYNKYSGHTFLMLSFWANLKDKKFSEKRLLKVEDKNIKQYLNEHLIYLFDELGNSQKQVLCFCAFIYRDFENLEEHFEKEDDVFEELDTLNERLLLNEKEDKYSINQHIREIVKLHFEGTEYMKKVRGFKKLIEFRESNPKDRIENFEFFVKDSPYFIPYRNELAISYKLDKQYKKAIEVLNKALKINPNDVKTLNEKAICLKEQKQYDKAIEVLNKALEIDNSNVKILNEKAICFKEQKQYKEAIEVLNKALEIDNKDVKTLNEKAICLKEQKQYKKAIEVLNKALEIDKNHIPSYNEKAICYSMNKDYQNSEMTCLYALNIHSKNLQIHSTLAYTYKFWGKKEKAKETLEKGLKLNPYDKVFNRLYNQWFF